MAFTHTYIKCAHACTHTHTPFSFLEALELIYRKAKILKTGEKRVINGVCKREEQLRSGISSISVISKTRRKSKKMKF